MPPARGARAESAGAGAGPAKILSLTSARPMMVDIINIDALWNVASVVLVAAAIGGEGGFDTVHDVPSFVNAFVGNAFDNEMSTMATMNRKSPSPPQLCALGGLSPTTKKTEKHHHYPPRRKPHCNTYCTYCCGPP